MYPPRFASSRRPNVLDASMRGTHHQSTLPDRLTRQAVRRSLRNP
jgi:hypothetical protein